MATVELRRVSKIYDGQVVAVKEADLFVGNREFIVLVGPSGCGKSTLLRMIAGLEEITSGELLIDQQVVNTVPPKDRDIAMVFQNYALYPHMTVYENMAFGLTLRRFPKAEIDGRVREAADILGIGHLLDRRPKALSGGQRQRVAVGRAIVRKPKVFLFDEPLSNLDAKMRVQMRAEISRLHHRLQTTMIYVTHDQVEAMTLGNRIVVMRDGVIQQVDTPLGLYRKPKNKFVAGFIGSPAMNFIRGKIERLDGLVFVTPHLRLELVLRETDRLIPFIGGTIELGIRPEHIQCRRSSDEKPAQPSFPAVVDVVEPMGNETLVYLRVGEDLIIARTNPKDDFYPGESCLVIPELQHAHFFNPENERAV